ncbi:MAG: amidohydrolase family protein [Verrucomicrobia bacterium]|nr:amidohydrolase family protein [Verrucomicrobiota bacterium]
MSKLSHSLAAAALLAMFQPANAEILPPGNRPLPPGHHALKHATVVVKPGVTITNATVIIRDGRIQAVTEKSQAPDTAREWDMTGLTLYAGFIDPYVTEAKPISTTMTQSITGTGATAAGKPGFLGTTGNELDPGTTGPGSGLSTMKPEHDVTDSFSPKPDAYEALRAQGFTAAALTPANGIIRGQSALISLGQGSPNQLVIKPQLFQHIVFDTKASKPEEFPKSLMGVISAIRQTLSDAQHYNEIWNYHRANADTTKRPAHNKSLETLQAVLKNRQPVIIEPGSVLMVNKAMRLADEFGIHPVIVATGHEWRRPDLVKASTTRFIVPINLPKAPKMPSDSDWELVSLDQLRAWDWAPENPVLLQKNGLEIALTTHGLKDKKKFRENLLKVIERGLPKRAALAALTTTPAKLAAVADQLGTIEVGKLANLVVVEGDYFDPKAKLRGVWIEGRWTTFEPEKLAWIDKKKEEGKEEKGGVKSDDNKEEKPDTRLARSPIGEHNVLKPDAVLIRNATLWTSSKGGILKKHDLLIVDSKIKKIGRDIQAPENTHVIDAKGKHVTAGIIDAHNHSMILGSVNEGTLPSSAMVSIGDVVNSESAEIYRQLAGGLTVANLLHGSANPIGGQNAIIKLRLGQGPEALKFKAAPPGIKFALGENVKQSNWGDDKNTRFPQTRMGVPVFHENRFTAAWQYNREWRRFREKGGSPPRRDLELETLGQIIKGERWIHCHSYRQDEILAFMRTMEKFGVRVGTLQHVLEGYKVADEIAAHGAGGSCFADWWAYKYEVIDAIPYAGSLMHERGVVVSFNSDSSDLARRLNLEAAKAVKYGNTKETEALNFVTINPAKQLRVDHRVGSLEAGKDGDFAIWSEHPLSTRAVCLETWIEGKRYFERGEALQLAEARATEREKLLTKAKGEAKKDKKKDKEKDDDSDDARAAFFRRALETAHGLGVVDCMDCKIKTK